MSDFVSFETPSDDFPHTGEMIKLRVIDQMTGYDQEEWFLITESMVTKIKAGWRVDLRVAGAPAQ